jgi:hypothetical protein
MALHVYNLVFYHLSASEIWPYFCFQDNLLIEFQHREDVDNILKTVGYFKNQDQMPFRTRYIYKIPEPHGQTIRRHILDMNLPHIQYIEPVSFDLKTLTDTHLDVSNGLAQYKMKN